MTLGSTGRRAAAILAALGLIATLAGAQERPPPTSAGPDDPADHHPPEGHDEELHHRNAVAVVLGGTWESEEDDTFFTWGAEYERLFNPRLGLVVGVEHINEIDAWVFFAPLVYRHRSGGRLYTGPGLELKTRRPERAGHREGEGERPEIPPDQLPRKQEDLFLWRFGAGWTFEIHERYVFSPTVSLDLVREGGHWVEAVVFNVAVGFDF